MKKILSTLLFSFFSLIILSQVAPEKYYVAFTDKNNSPYSIDNPSEYLSQESIDRRSIQGIPIDKKDLPVNPGYVHGVAQIGVTILNRTKWLNGVTIETDDPGKIDLINALPYVKHVVKSSVVKPDPDFEKPFFTNESYITNTEHISGYSGSSRFFDYGPSYNQINMLNGVLMHEDGYRGEGKTIAVLDAGFDNADNIAAFDSLWNNGQILGTYDFVNRCPVTFNQHFHGSMVLSCMGGNYPGEIIGTAPKANYWLFRSEDGNSEYIIEEYNWVSAAEFADSAGADIINSSLGYTEFDDPSQNHTYQDMDGNSTPVTIGADVAASRGMIVVNSAGNQGTSFWFYLCAPSDGDSVMGVGAVDASGNYVPFSSRGPSYDGRVKPNVAAQGLDAYVAYPNGGYGVASGTSFSSPIIAGMVACLWQANPYKHNMDVFLAIEQSGSQYPNHDDMLGYGIPDFVEANSILTIIDSKGNITNEGLIVYPNPFTAQLNLVFKGESEDAILEIIDYAGRIVVHRKIIISKKNNLTINNLENLSKGVYIIRVISSGQIYTKKLIKN